MSGTLTLRATSVRSQNPHGFGGCIFTAKAIDESGGVRDAACYVVVRASASALGGVRVEPGQWWQVDGEVSDRRTEINGFWVTETQVEATNAVLLRPSGEHIVAFMAESRAFDGIGQTKARKLWEHFGHALYAHLDAGNVHELAKAVTEESARAVVAAWAQYGDSRTLHWLHAKGFDVGLGRKVLRFFGQEAVEKIEEDPYRLLSFCATWRQTDAVARTEFGVAVDDPRRLQGAVEEACYRVFARGHTTVLTSTLMDVLQGVFGPQSKAFRWRSLVPEALSQGLSNGSFVVGPHGVQPLGAMVMERQVALAVAGRLSSSGAPLLPRDEVDELLLAFQKSECIELNAEQREAVHLSATQPFVIITGGAGVGKTTVLKAIYKIYERAGMSIAQVALAGRAAKRMQEATGRPAFTIAGFLNNWKEGLFDESSVVVVDEASMVDIISMSRLSELLGPLPRLVLVGDPAQLMPVGPGLVLHSLVDAPAVPVARLSVVKRYGGAIASAAADIREGRWPELPHDALAPIGFIPTSVASGSDETVAAAVLELYQMDPANTQVLCARRNGVGGTKSVNALCQQALTSKAKPVEVWDQRHRAYVRAGFHLGDPILCTRNLWDQGLQNGSLGVLVEVLDRAPEQFDGVGRHGGEVLAWVDWDDGTRRPVVEEMLDDLDLGYAITVHKGQGSQWPRVIVLLTGRRLLDRTLVYTALTRAQRQVLLVGNEAEVREAVLAAPRAQSRQVALDLHVTQMLR